MTALPNSISLIIQALSAYMTKCGGPIQGWYCGVATDPKNRLFQDHNVSEAFGSWIYQDAVTDTAARQVEDYFLARGCKGGPGGGDKYSRYVYAYRITSTTRE